MSQTLPVNGFRLAENVSQFDEHFMKSYKKDSERGYFFLKLMFKIQKNCMSFITIYHFYQKK